MQGTDARFASCFVQSLSRTDRLVLMLHYAEELSSAEIGQVLDLSEPRVCDILGEIRNRARTALAVVGGGEPSLGLA